VVERRNSFFHDSKEPVYRPLGDQFPLTHTVVLEVLENGYFELFAVEMA
jgi:hypothetical protein